MLRSARARGEFVHANWVEIGWALRPQFWGRGYATEIGRAGLDWFVGAPLRALPRETVVARLELPPPSPPDAPPGFPPLPRLPPPPPKLTGLDRMEAALARYPLTVALFEKAFKWGGPLVVVSIGALLKWLF